MLRLANALRSVVQRCGEAGDAALEAHCKELDELYHMRDEPFTDEEAGRAIYESMRRGGGKTRWQTNQKRKKKHPWLCGVSAPPPPVPPVSGYARSGPLVQHLAKPPTSL